MEIADQLTKPLTRIYYYNEQLKEIEKSLPANSPAQIDTKEVIGKFTEMVDFFQKNVDDSINLHKVNSVAESLIGCPVVREYAGKITLEMDHVTTIDHRFALAAKAKR